MKKLLGILVLGFWVIFYSNSFSATEKPLTVMQEVKALGVFTEPTDYPEGMVQFFGKTCKKFHCRAKKAIQEMSKTFGRTQIYHQRHPGAQLHALAMFELFYLQQLKKNQKKVEKFIAAWPDKKKHGKTVVSLLKLNKSREQMRKALGMDLNTSVEEAMERYWVMGDFLEKGEIKKQKISKDIKKRGLLLAKYKKAVVDFKSSIQNQEDEKLYDKIKKKNN
tara:strand:- start:122 stop:784 length:663 start_codon:yes stop_codon:yes gene_type:complete